MKVPLVGQIHSLPVLLQLVCHETRIKYLGHFTTTRAIHNNRGELTQRTLSRLVLGVLVYILPGLKLNFIQRHMYDAGQVTEIDTVSPL